MLCHILYESLCVPARCLKVGTLASHRKRRLMAILDKHCAEENKIRCLPGGGGAGEEGVRSEFNFLYVPIDFGWNISPPLYRVQRRHLLCLSSAS